MGIEEGDDLKAGPEEIMTDEQRKIQSKKEDQISLPEDQKVETNAEQNQEVNQERENTIVEAEKRITEIINEAATKHKELVDRLIQYHENDARKILDQDDSRDGLLRAMETFGIKEEMDIRDIEIKGLDTILLEMKSYFIILRENPSINIRDLNVRINSLEIYLKNRLENAGKFVQAIENDVEPMRARLLYLKTIDDFGPIWNDLRS